MHSIRLNKREWKLDTRAPLGSPGGFGEVFRGHGGDGPVAIKRLKLTAAQAAHREMQIGYELSQRTLTHAVPILDAGQDANSDRYYLVMPICDQSLQDKIDALEDGLSADETINILLQILFGLDELSNLTHRDLKPSNVLLHEGAWKIADFGIAKFVEDSTSLETLRTNLTPAYAAPEQWRLIRPTAATDIYALGCIAHALMTGGPPFSGDVDALREQHLNQTAPPIAGLPARARALVSQMLRKAPDVRPKRSRCIEVLQALADSENRPSAPSLLSEAVSAVAIEQAQREAERQAREERQRQRDAVFEEARRDLSRIRDSLFSTIRDQAADLIDGKTSSGRLTFGKATVIFDTSISSYGTKGIQKCYGEDHLHENGWGAHKRKSEWEIIAFTTISVEQILVVQRYMRRSNLVFGRPDADSEYRWYEMSFWSLSSGPNKDEPFALEYVWDIDRALAMAIDTIQLAHQPMPIDGEDEQAFIDYWTGIVAKAAVGNLTRPASMPIAR